MIVVLILAAVAIPVLYYLPMWQADTYFRVVRNGGRVMLQLDKDYFDVENESRKTLAQIVLGVFGLVAVYLTWVRTRAQDIQARVAQAQGRLAEQGHFTDRFTKAIEQLGAVHDDGRPKIEVRLGAIYALERLARDSEKDHQTIVEILCAYVRENAKMTGMPQLAQDPPPLRMDVQAALTVIGRRERGEQREKGSGDKRLLDFRDTDLRRANLDSAHLEGANFVRANLEGAFLGDAHLEGAILSRANLDRANLGGTRLERASLVQCSLVGRHSWLRSQVQRREADRICVCSASSGTLPGRTN
jgi:hypothetical protein